MLGRGIIIHFVPRGKVERRESCLASLPRAECGRRIRETIRSANWPQTAEKLPIDHALDPARLHLKRRGEQDDQLVHLKRLEHEVMIHASTAPPRTTSATNASVWPAQFPTVGGYSVPLAILPSRAGG